MATSGTVAQTQVSVETLLAHAFNRCGKLISTVGGELLDRAREALYYQVADLGNEGINLWCMTKSVVNVAPNETAYSIPVGTQDVTQVLYRQLWAQTGSNTVSAGAVTADLTAASLVSNVTGQFTAPGAASLAVEYSLDNVTWVTLTTLQAFTVVAGAVFVIDLDNSALARYWRIRDTTGTLLGMTNVRFRKVNNEVTMWKLNRDDYTNLPNKQYIGGKTLQFWYDKQIEPRLFVWPMSNQAADQLVIWSASQIQDPGDLSNELAVPPRWYRSIQASLSHQVAFLIPPNELPPGRLAELKADADECRVRASNGESDGSSFKLAPDISGYTR